MEIVYVRGGDPSAPKLAAAVGMRYGVRHDYTAYGDVWMLDINWKRYNWQHYLTLVRQYQPFAALAPDYEYSWQYTSLIRQLNDLREFGVQQVMVAPKFLGAVQHLPSWVVVALSEPTTYSGFVPDIRDLAGRHVHILGGSIHAQVDRLRKLRGVDAIVVSVDTNQHAMKAARGQYFDGKGWIQTPRNSITNDELATISGRNMVRYLQSNASQKWKILL